MRAEDILWGGNNKCSITLKNDIGMPEGVLTNIEYDYILEQYRLTYNYDSTLLEMSESSRTLLDNIYLSGKKPATIVRAIDRDGLDYIIEIKVFQTLIQFNALQAVEIQIRDEVVEKMRIKDKENPIGYLNSAFKYGNMLFVKGYGRKGADFSLLSKDRVLHIRQENNVYIATNLVRYDARNADYDAVYILQGEVSFVDSSRSARVSSEVIKMMNQITSGGEYFDVWEAYNDLDRMFAFKQATENGIRKYKSYTCRLKESFEYCFELSGGSFDSFQEGQQIDCTDDDNILSLEKFANSEQMKRLHSVTVGVFDRIEGNKCYIIDNYGDSQKKLPNQGFLFVSIVGDAVRLSRRERAKSDIITDSAPIKGLVQMIDKGAAIDKAVRDENPVTEMLKRKYPDKEFNKEQRAAIKTALDTPDIAMILGPPGTGKTTVIKAIIARYEEYFKKHNDCQIPRILVTSFQHEAVENVIVGMDGNGLPSDRKGGKRDGQDKKSESIRDWRDSITEFIQSEIHKLVPEGDETQTVLRDQIYAWQYRGKDPAEGIQLLKTAVAGKRLLLSEELNDKINEILARTDIGQKEESSAISNIEEESREEIRQILLSQRTTPEAYEDDGKKQANMLKYKILLGDIDNEGDVDFIDKVLKTKGKDPEVFKAYTDTVQRLKGKYLKDEKASVAIPDLVSIEQCLKAVDTELEQKRIARLENRNEAMAAVLQTYLEQIQDEKEIEKIIQHYANITAATCQQSMEVGKWASNTIYDLVIVDEAARANPLDLLIPMSMGKQVILVGDHKQLPHMLDPDVVKAFEKNDRMQELGVLGQSLFERLYRAFDKSNTPVKRTARLSRQYRMHPAIGEFASENFYTEYPLDSSEIDIAAKQANLGMYNNSPIAWINLDKNKYGMEEGRQSKARIKEAKRIVQEVRAVLNKDPHKTIGIISFYKLQSEKIHELVNKELTDIQREKVSVGTVDAFQGKEFDVVFLSCVRANTIGLDDMRHRVGHISDMSRLCVSFTRARQLLIVVGDRDTVSCIPVFGEFISKCEEGGAYFE